MSLKPIDKPAELTVEGKSYAIPILQDAMGNRALDIRTLRKDSGLIAFDPGFASTAVCESSITYVDGEKGLLSHRGYSIEDLTENCTFIEVAYLLLHGVLPNRVQREKFSQLLNRHSMIHEDMSTFFRGYPEGAHPMVVLSAMVVSLSAFYPEIEQSADREELDMTVTRLLSKLRTIAAFSYKKSVGEPFVYPSQKLSYCENFLNMMFSSPVSDYKIEPYLVKAMNQLLIIHADHEQNASTATVRQVGSTRANLYAAISAGICALWGPLHGGANQAVIEMLQMIHRDGLSAETVLEKAKNKADPFRLMGFGHRIYKSYDPRAKIAKKICYTILDKMNVQDPLLDVAIKLEEKAIADPYFQDRHLYPNVDFYTGITYRAMGFPTAMYTVLFALGRLPGWIAHWLELRQDADQKIYRPRQLYVGATQQNFVPLEKRP
ncbi:MAG TPA: citrate (Si)-synthase [Verrucomicrobia bacterium]|nr:MAG: citrate (Si)-synthase [Lentisphaerae bacterium GWF2_57_35]HBA85490.1 citrate (Si)-synthase [Verrucomicrobiota bacterium]